jgi:chromosome segregation ATPase
MEYTMKKTRYPTAGRELDGADRYDPADTALVGVLAGIQGQLARLDERTLTTTQAVERLAQKTDSLSQTTEALSHKVEANSHKVEALSHKVEANSHKVEALSHKVEALSHETEARFVLADRRQVELDIRLTARLDSVETKLDGLLAWKQHVMGAVLAAGILGGVLSSALDTVSRLLGVPR